MIPSNEMLNEWFKLNHPNGDANDFAMYWAGIAAYAHLSSAGSEQWKREHGFTEKGGQGMSCYNCKNYEPWGGLGDATLQHYCGKDGQIGVRCNPSESEDCIDFKPRKED